MAKKVIKKTLGKTLVKAFSEEDAEDEVNRIIGDAFKQTNKELFSSLSKGGTRQDIIDRLQNVIGKSQSYLDTYVDTGLSVIGRERIADTAQDLGLTWYRYIGGTIKTSRDFCIERDGGYYHELEIEDWADEDWDGKIEGTNSETIFSYCGGWNCRHDLIPVLTQSVPESDLQRVETLINNL